MAKIILTRHGETPYNVARKITGRGSDPALTEKGVDDTHKLAHKLHVDWGDEIDFIVSSSMTRTNQTAEIINTKLEKPVHYDVDLQEIDQGTFEGQYGPDLYTILDEAPDHEHPAGGESRIEFSTRVTKAICKYLHDENDVILLVSHGWTGIIAHKIFLEEELKHFDNNHYIIIDPEEINDLAGKCASFISGESQNLEAS
jgi:broad specificity phosphatase PhoE